MQNQLSRARMLMRSKVSMHVETVVLLGWKGVDDYMLKRVLSLIEHWKQQLGVGTSDSSGLKMITYSPTHMHISTGY